MSGAPSLGKKSLEAEDWEGVDDRLGEPPFDDELCGLPETMVSMASRPRQKAPQVCDGRKVVSMLWRRELSPLLNFRAGVWIFKDPVGTISAWSTYGAVGGRASPRNEEQGRRGGRGRGEKEEQEEGHVLVNSKRRPLRARNNNYSKPVQETPPPAQLVPYRHKEPSHEIYPFLLCTVREI